MKRAIPFIALILMLGACRQPSPNGNAALSKTDSIAPVPPLHVAGQSYRFGPSIDTSTCKVQAPCDCCVTDIAFPDDKHFVAIFYCLEDNTYAHGTYRIDGDKVYLDYYPKKVDELTDLMANADTLAQHGDTLVSKTKYEVGVMPHHIDTLHAFMCRGTVAFKCAGLDYGSPETTAQFTINGINRDSILLPMDYK
jgi:hypothetical protein